MDETDYRILKMLRENGRENFVTVAKQLKITEGTVRNRVKRMLERGEIKKFTVKSSALEGLVLIKCPARESKRIIKQLQKMTENVFEISGEYDIAAIMEAAGIEQLNKSVDAIRKIKGVKATNTGIKLAG